MASKEPLTIKVPKLIKILQEMTESRQLYEQANIVRDMLSCLDATREMRTEALAGQAILAQQLGRRGWLHRVSVEVDNLQFNSREWISTYILHLLLGPVLVKMAVESLRQPFFLHPSGVDGVALHQLLPIPFIPGRRGSLRCHRRGGHGTFGCSPTPN